MEKGNQSNVGNRNAGVPPAPSLKSDASNRRAGVPPAPSLKSDASNRSAGVSPAPSSSSDASNRNPGAPLSPSSSSDANIRVRKRFRLPHWEVERGIYFVTFRLCDSLPRSVLKTIEEERADIVRTAETMRRALSPSEQKRLDRLFTRRVQEHLDTGSGACHLKNPRIAKVVSDALQHFDGKRYRLFAWCVMPNHVHAVFQPLFGHHLADILHAWKSYTGKKANRMLRRSGEFWQREYYDHLIREPGALGRIVGYVAENPVKAGLRDWPWVKVYEDRL